ncbi:dTMP kinase [Candidatus Pacearchaeota archaeon]|nr:dTMP kinase [Candidatus Pacearchaeota archaeon]
MPKKTGLFVVFEGIDGAGTSTQVHKVAEEIEKISKYQDVVRTHEPWDSKDIKKKIEEDKDAYSGAEELAELFIDDRARHTRELIRPNLKAEAIVICDRYSMSTCTYQWAQGIPINELMHMHKDRAILVPDITFFVDVEQETAEERTRTRSFVKEKFERNPEFTKKLINAYRASYYLANVTPSIFGKVVRINGNKIIEEVTSEIMNNFRPLYEKWESGEYSSPKQNP